MRLPVIVLALVLASGCRLAYTGGAKPVDVSKLDATWLRASATPIVVQRERTDCGLAALAMIAGAWGLSWPIEDLRARVVMSERGVKLGALRDVARANGLQAYAIAGTYEDLRRELSKGRPIVIGLQLPFERDRTLHHYEVVVAVRPHDGTVVTLDPATGKSMRRSQATLIAEWKPVGFPALVVVGTADALNHRRR